MLRYTKGDFIVVPESAPLVDHVIWVLALVRGYAGFALLLAWTAVFQATQKKGWRHADADDS